jgi:SAM-dependent MidA family methyltransferase
MKKLSEIIHDEIEKAGVLTFARFMELALYHPKLGYYETQKKTGRGGDFFTSVSVGELFGQLLAFQFVEWIDELTINRQPSTINICEAGAHDGQLARDILIWLQIHRPKLFEQIKYWIIEPSARRQSWQNETLKQFAPRVRWFTDFENFKLETQNSKLTGIIFSNELLDAMPIRRLRWDARSKKWFEWGVALENKKFVWARIPTSGFRLPTVDLPSPLLAVLPDGYTIEISPAAENWWRAAANVLEHGKLLTMDYGFTDDEMFSPSRTRGTLRAYFRHHVSDDVLANVGEQDLTAHVNFSALQAVGESAGLITESFLTQSQFLTRILEKTQRDKPFGEWDAHRARQFQTLTHPEHLGRRFRVLVQSRRSS